MLCTLMLLEVVGQNRDLLQSLTQIMFADVPAWAVNGGIRHRSILQNSEQVVAT
jgi:hypothetical protein